MEQVLNNLGPLFIIIVLGAVLARLGWFSDGFTKPLNRLMYWVALPAMVIVSLSGARFDAGATLRVFGTFMGGTALMVGLALLVAWLLRLPVPSAASFVQAAFRGNLALIGLPVVSYQLLGHGATSAETESVLATAALTLGGTMIVYNVVSVLVLLPCFEHQRREQQALAALHAKHLAQGVEDGVDPETNATVVELERPSMIHQIVTNPLILASLIGALLSVFSISLPQFAFNTLRTLGNMAVPGALLCIGASLGTAQFAGRVRVPSICALLKVAVLPLLTFGLAKLVGLSGQELMVVMLFSACPTAAASFIMAERMGGDAHLAGSAIALSTLFSAVPLAVVLALFGS